MGPKRVVAVVAVPVGHTQRGAQKREKEPMSIHPKDLSAALGYECQLRNIDLDCNHKRRGWRANQAVLQAMRVLNQRRAPRSEAEILGVIERFYRKRADIALRTELSAAGIGV